VWGEDHVWRADVDCWWKMLLMASALIGV
jgi:hypothetical protein